MWRSGAAERFRQDLSSESADQPRSSLDLTHDQLQWMSHLQLDPVAVREAVAGLRSADEAAV